MEAIQAIMTRRSIRKFESKPVPADLVDTVLRAAMAAPSAGNQQSWQFVVVDDRKTLNDIASMHVQAGMAGQASLAVLVCGDLTAEQYKGFWVQDCSAAIQNMLLAAHAVGLGAVWSGIYPVEGHIEKFSRFFSLPEHIIPLAVVVIGHPAESPTPADRFDQAKLHHNGW